MLLFLGLPDLCFLSGPRRVRQILQHQNIEVFPFHLKRLVATILTDYDDNSADDCDDDTDDDVDNYSNNVSQHPDPRRRDGGSSILRKHRPGFVWTFGEKRQKHFSMKNS